jgi:hypothetical protein
MIFPEDGEVISAIILINVDFPEPLGPEIPNIPLFSNLKFILLKISLLPNTLLRETASTE